MASAKITYPMRQLHCNWSRQQNHHPPQNKFNGHAVPLAPMQRCSRPVQILLGTWPRQFWRLQHQETSPNLPPLPTEDPTDFPLLPSAHCNLVFFSLCSQFSLQGCVDPQVFTCIHSTSEHNMIKVHTLYGSGLTSSQPPT